MPSKMQLNRDQKEVFKALQQFMERTTADTFVLKGYAGTGKTFLMQEFARWMNSKEYRFALLASTGRAATILRGKTGFEARTLHSELYQFSKVDGDTEDIAADAPIDQYGQMTLQFTLRKPDLDNKVYIIDESSMLTSEQSKETLPVAFGSGFLLNDFFEAAGNNKIIFVGDPGQLPPVGQAFSPALDQDWLVKQGRTAIVMTLEKIERQTRGNDLLNLASAIRNMQPDPVNRFIRFPGANRKNTTIHPSESHLFYSYVHKFLEAGTNGTLAIARSNRMVNDLNRAVRRELFGQTDLPLQEKEVLMVVQNNYSVPLTNGDFVTILELGEEYLRNGLHFKKAKVIAHSSGEEYDILLSLDILYGNNTNFSREQSRQLMVEFSRRMKNKNIPPNSASYKQEMLKDPYLNCLRVKYGYAVTCHKAQGGEWDEVFLFLEKSMYAMEPSELFRWWYTAVTRARQRLHIHQAWWVG